MSLVAASLLGAVGAAPAGADPGLGAPDGAGPALEQSIGFTEPVPFDGGRADYASGDFDRDGHLDLVSSSSDERSISVLAGDGTGAVQPVEEVRAAALPSVDAFVAGHSLAALERLAAVVRGADGPAVWVVDNGQVRQQPVTPGARVGEEVELKEGPPPGTQVVVAPDSRLRAGRAVKVRTEGA